MNFEGILQLIMDNYSSFIATLALLLSALTFIMSQRHTKKNKIISDERYYEQRKQYEERLEVESERREGMIQKRNYDLVKNPALCLRGQNLLLIQTRIKNFCF